MKSEMSRCPMAGAVPRGLDKVKIGSQTRQKFSGSLANNTKWNELLTFIREQGRWRPSYRSKWVNGHVSAWDREWFYHLPFPFVGVEWFDIGLHERASAKEGTIDHAALIVSKLAEIGFEFEVKDDVVRIWGYAPKPYEDFPPA